MQETSSTILLIQIVKNKYIAECERFIFPYVYSGPMFLSGLKALIRSSWKVVIWQLPSVYLSYSVMSLLVLYRDSISSIYLSLISAISVPQFLPESFQNWIVLLLAVWIISLYDDPIRKSLDYVGISPTILFTYCLHIFNAQYRIVTIARTILDAPLIIREHRLSCRYKPFVDPLTLPAIVQKAVENVEGKSCNVSRWSRELKSEEDVENLKRVLIQDQEMPGLIKILVKRCKAKDALNRISIMQPLLYIGTVANRCVFLGRISYDPHEKVRMSVFYFDTVYIKREFKYILEKEIEKQRELRSRLPVPLEEIISK